MFVYVCSCSPELVQVRPSSLIVAFQRTLFTVLNGIFLVEYSLQSLIQNIVPHHKELLLNLKTKMKLLNIILYFGWKDYFKYVGFEWSFR